MVELFIIGVCLLANALFAGTEMAFVTVSKPRLRELARTGNRVAHRILILRENPERTLSVIQVGITLVGIIAAAVGGAGAEEALSPILKNRLGLNETLAEILSIVIVVIPLTFLNVVAGELVPKAIALKNPIKIVSKSARWLIFFDRVLSPIVTALEWSTKKILKFFFYRSKPEPPESSETVDLELLSLQTRQYVLNLVGVENKRIKDVLLPWSQVISVNTSLSPAEVEHKILTSGHTRLPVLEDDQVIGILNTKEFMALRRAGETHWVTLIRPQVQVQEGDSLLRAFRQMQEKRSHLSIVYNRRERTGIVTMEDILEEVMGDIYDEDDDGVLRRILSSAYARRTLSQRP
jgi:putative hemolysin